MKKKTFGSWILLFSVISTVIWFLPAAMAAEAEEPKEGVYTLGEVVVSAQQEVVETAGTVREVTAREIQNKNARTLDQALELLPGVEIRTGAGGIPRVDIRGFRSRHVLLLLDGIPLNSTYDGQFDPSIIPTENIAKIKVSYGANSVLYGQGGMGGVINIITKTGKQGIQGMASGEIGEGSSRLGRFNVGGAAKDADFFVSGSMEARKDFPLSNDFQSTSLQGGGERNNSDNRRNNLFGNIGYSPTEEWDLGLVASFVSGHFGMPPTTQESTKTDPDIFAAKPKYERVNHFEGFNAQFSTSYDLPGPVDIRGWAYYNHYDEDRTRYDDENYNSMTTKNTYFEDGTSKNWGGTIQTALDLTSAGSFTLALDAQKQEYDSKGKILDVKVGKEYEARNFDNAWSLWLYSASLEYEITLFDRLGVVLGYGHYWQNKEEGANENKGSYMAGAYYDIIKGTRVRGAFAKKIRFPSLRQLYQIDEGNPDLVPESSYNYELGVEQTLPLNSRVAVNGFLSDVDNYIEKPFTDEPFQNYDKYLFQGFEVTAETRFIERIMLRLGYTFMDTKDKSPNSQKDELQYRPRHKLTLEGKYTFYFGLSAYANIIYNADQIYYSRSEPLQKRELDNFAIVNLKFDQPLINGRLDVYVGADNLFDKNYEESYGFPAEGRVIYGGVAVNF
jgi:outer membrane cobalamin receptor